ncbi:hypothetical protein CDA63_08005 [Hymenobacter amundsenii]|uniref:Lipocalin-like domain-containing protein n=1 Tax=Hymenobacter amundsenii TaxID=2006685 RepID=A0A246FLW9_9BACT|nr:hypothetical protein [Hymenobacter amundsenii]OWP63720.1 hypothetical protein CDA63_08005 [Hymenobacter amundsenii]
MKNLFKKAAPFLLFLGLSFGSQNVFAQKRIAAATQQGNGAYVQKVDRNVCITNSLLGIPNLEGGCLTMNQDKFLVTPSGNAMSVWTGTVSEANRPATRLVYNSTWTETNNDGVTRTYDTVAVTEPDGSVKLSLNDKDKGKSNGRKNGRGKN